MRLSRAVAGALTLALTGVCAMAGARPVSKPLAGIRSWAVYYGTAAEAAATLARFDLVVVDPGAHPPLPAIRQRGARVLAYVSLGEVNVNHPLYAPIAGEPWLLEANANWPDARRLDVRAPGYERWLVDLVVPAALATGADGLFLDTADTPIEAERTTPARFGGSRAALGAVIDQLRARHPRALIVMNGGLPLLERVADTIDAVALESVWSTYDFEAKRYVRRPAAEAQERVARLRAVRARGVPVLTLEYASPDDTPWVRRLLTLARGEGFVPYVATIGLTDVFTDALER
ncbi:MAG TPA: endo alpha-1,4 polygalactosaminidase [Methylomirabilota bacterium]|nr:endo alpha-1,4 polygalactosaminidase [Methylomirabilota bacterium]